MITRQLGLNDWLIQEIKQKLIHKTNRHFDSSSKLKTETGNGVRAAGVHFVCAGKTRVISNCSHLFRSHMLRSCQFRVGVLYFAQVCTTFVVYSVTNSESNARKNGWYCIKTWKNTKMDVCHDQWESRPGIGCKFHYWLDVRHYLKK